ncbi:GntR family transcriptional regulator [Streptomyces fuscigenes]|uniref:GntR family transcriptional regulator n=1 Tax=Streptomyces fuscigenes TaxID=1528880 RepID=UPI001F299855|nr:GntR family transcriptional regulator [Streptomyces fuscigenes]MCF3960811.1 GntR family transcriptional regulator [Streptomyces fuscigenes]
MTGPVPPRHHAIADDLRQQITTGRMHPGERLPSETALADRYGVSTVTLRRALATLQGEGLVQKIHGKGNFVRRPVRKMLYVSGWGTFDPWTAAEPALRVTVRRTTVQAHGHIATLLKVPTGSPVSEFSCLSLQGESPHGLARIYMPCDLTPAGSLDDDSAHRRALARFAVLGPLPQAAVRESVSARPPTPDEASALRIGSTAAVLAITRIATDSRERVVEAALLTFPGDRVDAVFTSHHLIDERPTQDDNLE